MPPCEDAITQSTAPGLWFWAALFIAVAVYEVWAIWTKHLTLTQTTQRGPKWFKWALGAGLGALLWHLFL